MKILNLLFVFLPLVVICQESKTYTGDYSLKGKSRYSESGKGTYKYYENEASERVKDGSFSFQGSTMKIEGQFKNGLRNGLWKFTYTNTSKYSDDNHSITVASATYINGKLNGKCTYTKTEITTKKIIESSTAYFKDNLLIGNYEYISLPQSDFEKKITIKYSQDSLGRLSGEYRAEFYQECCSNLGEIEDVVKYEAGIMTYRLCREKVDGTVYYKYENGSYSKLLDKYGSGEVFSSTWRAYIGADFWLGGDCQYCGTRYNPIYALYEGIDDTGFTYLGYRQNLKGQ